MRVNNLYTVGENENKYNFLMLSVDAKAEEEFGIIELNKSIKNNTFNCELEIINYKKIKIPCLVINKNISDKNKDLLKDVNGGEMERKLYFASKCIDDLKTLIKERIKNNENVNSMIWVNYCKDNNSLFSFGGEKFLASFSRGKTLIIFPNPYYYCLPKKYFNKSLTNEWYYSVNEKYLNDNILNEARKSKRKCFENNCKIIESCFKSFKENGVIKLYNHHLSGLSGAIAFIPKEDILFTKKNDIFPYKINSIHSINKIELIRKEENELNLQINERSLYNKLYKEALTKKDLFNKSFKKGESKLYINHIKIQNNESYFWINTNFSSHSDIGTKWYTENELIEIMKNLNIKLIKNNFFIKKIINYIKK